MKNNKLSLILVLSIIISFISGALGSIILYNVASNDTGTTIIKPNNNNVILNEDNSISKGVANVYDAVVVVEGFTKEKLASTGTGFIYKQSKDKAYIMTNHHVIAGVETVKIILSDNSVVDAKVMGSEAYSDIAVLSVDANKIKSIAIMGDSTKLNVGDTLFTVGSPEGSDYAGTVTKGILSGKDRLVAVALSPNTNSDYYMRVLQTDAAINPGNSGGPICNINGEVIGVTNMKLVDATVEGMGFAIPIEDALFYASTLEKGEPVKRPYVGIGMLDITDGYVLWQNGITLDESITSGVAVLEVAEDSPAEKAKLQKGDIIISLAGEKIKSIAQFRYVLYKQKPNDTVIIEYVRDKKVNKIELKLGENKN